MTTTISLSATANTADATLSQLTCFCKCSGSQSLHIYAHLDTCLTQIMKVSSRTVRWAASSPSLVGDARVPDYYTDCRHIRHARCSEAPCLQWNE